jgi:hypothetical protein
MSTDDRQDQKLPVTAEVGGEGGSYADAVLDSPEMVKHATEPPGKR